MKLLSWNVNGLRAVERKKALDWIWASDLDAVCLQETKAMPEQLGESLLAPEGWVAFFNSAERKGYSGVVTYVREALAPQEAVCGMGIERFDREGRVVATDLGGITLLNVYFPNGTSGPERLAYKMDFYASFQKHVNAMRKKGRKLVVCGDVNTAHREIDLARPKENVGNSGFLPEERAWVDGFLDSGWIDSFRSVNGEVPGRYTWWSYRLSARARNVGWRIDYFLVAKELEARITDAWIDSEVMGSDHCPVGLRIAARNSYK